MLNDTLPSQIDVRKLVVQGAHVSAAVPVSSLPRFVDLLSDQSGVVEVDLHFYLDDERIRMVAGHLCAQISVICQRCLDPMSIVIDADVRLGIVWSEDDSKRLPRNLDPLIVGEELVDLSDIVSEELILSFPSICYHDEENCRQSVGYACSDPNHPLEEILVDTNRSGKENPFKVLEQLKPGNKV